MLPRATNEKFNKSGKKNKGASAVSIGHSVEWHIKQMEKWKLHIPVVFYLQKWDNSNSHFALLSSKDWYENNGNNLES